MKTENPELKDITEMIGRYIASNKGKVAFVGHFVCFDAKGECECCGEHGEGFVNEDKSKLIAYGDVGLLRQLINDLRDVIEDESDKDGFVKI